jgi:glycerophosphoryl diester phosphodiesterase
MKKINRGFDVIAHRGASGYAPENTLAAFSKAVLLGAPSVEFDVQETKDRELVVIHDPNLKRLARDSRALVHVNYAELAKLDVGSWFGAEFRDQRVPTLEQVLDFFGGTSRNIELQIEIKDGRKPYPGIERKVLEALRHRPTWNGRVVISSFNHAALQSLRELAPAVRLGYLANPQTRSATIKDAVRLACESVHISLRRADAAWAEAVHAAGMRLLVYTVNSAKDLERVRRIGADGVFSDFPDIGADGSRP